MSIRAHSESEGKVSFRWRVPSVYYETVEEALVFDGTIEEERGTKGLPLVFLFVGVALLPALIDAIFMLWHELVQPGLVIDARGREIKIDVDSTLPPRTILVCDKTGCQLHEPNAPRAELTEALVNAMRTQ